MFEFSSLKNNAIAFGCTERYVIKFENNHLTRWLCTSSARRDKPPRSTQCLYFNSHADDKKIPDPPSRHHLPAETGFRGLKRRCLRSLLSFDLETLDRLAAYSSIRLSRRSSRGQQRDLRCGAPAGNGISQAQLAI